MEVSSFELIYKPQSPVGAADRVIQGYFLNITNLETTQLIFRVDFITSSVPDPDRSLFDNTVAFIDTPEQNNNPARLVGDLASASFQLKPVGHRAAERHGEGGCPAKRSVPDGRFAGQFRSKGLCHLAPASVDQSLRRATFERAADRGAARVLLTPQNRATYLDSTGTINDQTQASLPTASGAARDEVQAEPGSIFVPSPASQSGSGLNRRADAGFRRNGCRDDAGLAIGIRRESQEVERRAQKGRDRDGRREPQGLRRASHLATALRQRHDGPCRFAP